MKSIISRANCMFALFVLVNMHCWSQTPHQNDSLAAYRAVIINGDTVPCAVLPEIFVFKPLKFKNERQYVRYTKLVRDVKKTLPLAKIAGSKLSEVNVQLQYITDPKERKAFLKQTEKDMLAQYEGSLRGLTFSQGRLLIKLIDRECSQTSYELIKMYRGGFSAFFWQTLARTFGANLKSEYNLEDDKMIEQIVIQVEMGLI